MHSCEKLRPYPFVRRMRTMLRVDLRRMFTMPMLYLLVAACLVMPVVILVMTAMMDGSVTYDPQTGAATVIQGFQNTWQIIGTVSSDQGAMSMDITSMCNINMLYFFVAVLVCSFVSGDFRSGYAKNLFALRAKKTDYVISKTLVCALGGGLMILAFIAGSMVGGAVAGLPFDMVGFGVGNAVACLLGKVVLVGVFVPIYLMMSVIAKQKLWLSTLLSLMTGMFLFMMIPMTTPLDSTAMHVLLCLAGGAMFSFGLGWGSTKILEKTSLV